MLDRPLTRSKVDPTLPSTEINRDVASFVKDGLSIYEVLETRLAQIDPDIIVTQDTCEVCAVSFDEVNSAVNRLLKKESKVISLSPLSLEDVFSDIIKVGKATNKYDLAKSKVDGLKRRLEKLKGRRNHYFTPKVLMIEWIDPLMIAGHWTPELVRFAGGNPILGKDNSPTGPIDYWDLISGCAADIIVLVPCGFKISQTMEEIDSFLIRDEIKSLPAYKNNQIFAIDGNSYFNRPGPRLVDSAEILSVAIDPINHFEYKPTDFDLKHIDLG